MSTKTKKAGAGIDAPDADHLIEILSPGGPRRRAGMEFGPQPAIIDWRELDGEAIRAIEADPLLTVRPHRPAPAEDSPVEDPPA